MFFCVFHHIMAEFLVVDVEFGIHQHYGPHLFDVVFAPFFRISMSEIVCQFLGENPY